MNKIPALKEIVQVVECLPVRRRRKAPQGRKTQLLGQIILAVKQLCSGFRATRQHIDSKKLEVVDFARAGGTKLAGAYGRDYIHLSSELLPCQGRKYSTSDIRKLLKRW